MCNPPGKVSPPGLYEMEIRNDELKSNLITGENKDILPYFWCMRAIVSWPRPLKLLQMYHSRVNLAKNGPGTVRRGSSK